VLLSQNAQCRSQKTFYDFINHRDLTVLPKVKPLALKAGACGERAGENLKKLKGGKRK
jgi:hypothetical protein